MTRLAHVLFGGLGGHGSVVFSLVAAGGPEVEHVLVFVNRGELLEAYRRECTERNLTATHVPVGSTLGFRSHLRVAGWLRRQRPDAILVHSGGYLLAALAAQRCDRRRPKVVLVEHQSWPLRTRRHRLTTLLALVTQTPIVVLTEGYATALRGAHPRLARRSNIAVVPNGINVDLFAPAPKPPSVPGHAVVGMQSRLIDIKDHPTLLRAVAELRQSPTPVRLRLAGDGPTRAPLEALARDLGISDEVEFMGVLTETELVEFLQGLDVYVHASLGEAMSTALLQAFATALPVVASDVSGIREMVEGHDVAVLVPPTDAHSLATEIASLLTQEGERSHLGGRARQFVVSRYSSTEMWAGYEGVLGGPTSPPPTAPPVLRRLVSATLEAESPSDPCLAWPAGGAPRVAATSGRVGRWMMRTGILGGGRRPWARWLARQVPAWPLVRARAGRQVVDEAE